MQYTDYLETSRLITRFLTKDDAVAWVEYCKDPLAIRFTAFGKTPEDMALEGIELSLKRYEEGRFGLQALIRKETGALIGLCGLLQQQVNDKDETEIGYHLIPKYWGNGYATEAAQRFRDYAFENKIAGSVVSIIHPDNMPSKKVAMRNGMQLADAHAAFKGKKYELFRITRKEWEELKKIR